MRGRWRLDRWGRSLPDLVVTLQELNAVGVGFISLTEALDMTTPIGRAMAALLAVFAECGRDVLRERVKAGIAQASHRQRWKASHPHGYRLSPSRSSGSVSSRLTASARPKSHGG